MKPFGQAWLDINDQVNDRSENCKHPFFEEISNNYWDSKNWLENYYKNENFFPVDTSISALMDFSKKQFGNEFKYNNYNELSQEEKLNFENSQRQKY
ncbi:MAG: hypothetical protein ACK559_18875, partial [bacterium]